MADKGFVGFDIGDELKNVNLRLNIPPFLANQSAFSEGDVIKTQTVATKYGQCAACCQPSLSLFLTSFSTKCSFSMAVFHEGVYEMKLSLNFLCLI